MSNFCWDSSCEFRSKFNGYCLLSFCVKQRHKTYVSNNTTEEVITFPWSYDKYCFVSKEALMKWIKEHE